MVGSVVSGPVRIGLVVLGLGQGGVALWALLGPRSFFDDFPTRSANWVDAFLPYNEHLVRDYGASFLALSVLALGAAWVAERRLVLIALGVWLVSAVPHLVFHLIHAGEPPGARGMSSLMALGFNVVLPLVLLYIVRKENPDAPDRPRPG